MSVDKLFEELKKHAGIFEVYHITSFKCYRRAKNHEPSHAVFPDNTQEIRVDIIDMGPDANPKYRYNCIATAPQDEGFEDLVATGNGADTIEMALELVHWGNLDMKPEKKMKN